MRKTNNQRQPAPAPAFASWAKAQEQAEFARGRQAREQFADLASEVGELGYLLQRDEHTDHYLLYVAETSVVRPVRQNQMHFVRYVMEFDPHKQVVRCTRLRSAGPAPVAMLSKPWTLEMAVRAYVKAIKEKGDAPRVPKEPEPEAADQPDGE